MVELQLRFSASEIVQWARQYEIDEREDKIIANIVPRTQEAGFLNKPDFLEICEWKTPRTKSRCRSNPPEYICDITRIAFSTPHERLRIEILNLLVGVSWPTASVFLHFAHSDAYPILDFRALWSLGFELPPTYNFPFWNKYTIYCRQLARENNVSMRILDRALWQYSKKNQPPNTS